MGVLTSLLITLLCCAVSNALFGQDDDTYHMADTTVTTCTGTFLDDGQGAGAPYSTTPYTYTICPDNPGDVIQIDFVAFALYTSPSAQNSDYLQIFDGDDATASSLGSYTGTDLQGHAVTGTINNTTGCLTFVFQPNPNGNTSGSFPGWEGIISCTTPCAYPSSASEFVNPVPTGPDQSIGVCTEQPITFGDAGSSPAPGFSIDSYVWDYDDGTADTLSSPQDVTHTFDEPGEYVVTMSVVDDNGCESLNVEPLQVLVSTLPEFNTVLEDTVCLDSPTTIDGSAVQSVTWTALPPQVAAGETYLADGAGFEYSSTLTFDFFETGATLDDCNDIEEVFANMEHSYLGDLGINVTCPDGTTVQLLNYTDNNGAGQFLGEAIDGDATPTPGTGYDYGWSPSSTAGPIDETGTNGGETVPAGIYQSDEDMCNLVGCPLNGDWTFGVTDNLAIDNGYIFEWGITFNPELFPDVTTFTPIIGMGPDSTYLNGPNIINTSANGNIINTQYDTPGSYDYTFTAINNFGCAYDTTVTVTAIEGPEITAGPDIQVCEDPVALQAGLGGVAPPECSGDAGDYTYCYGNNDDLVVTYCPDTPGDGITFMELTINGGTIENFADNFYVYDGQDTNAPLLAGPLYGDLSGMNFSATSDGDGCITFEIISDGSISCESNNEDALDISVTCNNGGSELIWSWTPTAGLSNPDVQNPTVLVDQETTYTVTAHPANYPGCTITDQVTVIPDPTADPGIDNDTTLCYNLPQSELTGYLKGSPAEGGEWVTQEDSSAFASVFNPSDYPEGGTFNLIYTVTNGTCENSSNLTLNVLSSENPTCCQTNAKAGADTVACNLSYQLQAEQTEGYGVWSGPPEVTFQDSLDRNTSVSTSAPGGEYKLYWTDNNGLNCDNTDSVRVVLSQPLSLDTYSVNSLCADSCSGRATALASGGLTANDYQYEWDSGTMDAIPQARDSLCVGEHKVVVTDDYGCSDSTFVSIGEPEPITMQITATRPSCSDDCDGVLNVNASRGVEYSFDGGANFQTSSTAHNLCAGQYDIVVRDENGCVGFSEATLQDPQEFVAAFDINPNPTTTKNTQIEFTNKSGPRPVTMSHWVFGTDLDDPLDESDEYSPIFTFPSDTSGMYSISLTVENPYGCRDSMMQQLTIMPNLRVFVPNAFTPNGDGFNDIFRPVISVADFDEYKFQIFDRSGSTIFETTDPEKGWNGSINGGDYFAPIGLYTYRLKAVSATDQEKREVFGYVTLIR